MTTETRLDMLSAAPLDLMVDKGATQTARSPVSAVIYFYTDDYREVGRYHQSGTAFVRSIPAPKMSQRYIDYLVFRPISNSTDTVEIPTTTYNKFVQLLTEVYNAGVTDDQYAVLTEHLGLSVTEIDNTFEQAEVAYKVLNNNRL